MANNVIAPGVDGFASKRDAESDRLRDAEEAKEKALRDLEKEKEENARLRIQLSDLQAKSDPPHADAIEAALQRLGYLNSRDHRDICPVAGDCILDSLNQVFVSAGQKSDRAGRAVAEHRTFQALGGPEERGRVLSGSYDKEPIGERDEDGDSFDSLLESPATRHRSVFLS